MLLLVLGHWVVLSAAWATVAYPMEAAVRDAVVNALRTACNLTDHALLHPAEAWLNPCRLLFRQDEFHTPHFSLAMYECLVYTHLSVSGA